MMYTVHGYGGCCAECGGDARRRFVLWAGVDVLAWACDDDCARLFRFKLSGGKK